MYNRECIENQLIKIGHIYEHGQILDRNMLNIVYDVNLSIMQYNSLISAIPQQWRLHMRNGNNNNQVEQREDKFTIISLTPQKMVSKLVYKEMIRHISENANLELIWSEFINIVNIDT